jgi:hypothetical protein
VNVDIDGTGGRIDEQHRDRIAAARDELAVPHRQRVEQRAIADRAATDEDLHATRGGLREIGRAEIGGDAQARFFTSGDDEALRDPRAEQRARAGEAVAIGWKLEGRAAVVPQAEVDLRVRHRELRDELGDVRGLGSFALEELEPRGKIVEEVRDLDRGAGGMGRVGHGDQT